MSSHAVFIILSYTLGTLILGWTAISPLLKKRRLRTQLQQLQQLHQEDSA